MKWVAQCCNIEDAPRFGYRGFHLDPCRHFITVENVKKQLDLMSMFKVNTMHFHLTEDQGWRIEIKKYPKLTSVGSLRTEGDVKASTMNDSSVALAKGLHPIKVVFLANIIGGWPSWWSSTAIEMRKDKEKEFAAVGGSQLFR